MTAFIEVGQTLVNVDELVRIDQGPEDALGYRPCTLITRDGKQHSCRSFTDIALALEMVGCNLWLKMDGFGRKEPAPGEAHDRDWRSDPEDGLRPMQKIRHELARAALDKEIEQAPLAESAREELQ